MKNLYKDWGMVLTSALMGLVVAVSITRCGSSSSVTTVSYRQIERLARPVINEALVFSHANLFAFNSIPPSLDLSTGGKVDSTAVGKVIGDVANTLTAVYAGICFTAGHSLGADVATTSDTLHIKPGDVPCVATGTDIFSDITTSKFTTAFQGDATTGATGYVNKIAGQFLPDVTRIDTAIASAYGGVPQLCNGGAAGSPLLCGGRGLNDDVMNVTYGYLFQGSSILSTGQYNAYKHGTVYPQATATGNGAKSLQGHKDLLAAFPYAPNPY